MGSKVLLVLVMFMATILLITAEVAPHDLNEKFDTKNGKHGTNGLEESKYWGYHGGWGRPWYGGWRGGYYGSPWYGGWGSRRGGWGGGWGGRRGGWGDSRGGWGGSHEHAEYNIEAEPRH